MSIENIRLIAKDLQETSIGEMGGRLNYPSVEGIEYTFPFQELEAESYNAVFPPIYWETYQAMKELMVSEPLSDGWREFIKRASLKAQENGVDQPLDLFRQLTYCP